MDFTPFDKRRYPVVSAAAGYGEWAATYEETVAVGLDTFLLPRIAEVEWAAIAAAADLACGTGRTGAWLKASGVGAIDGVDVTREMLELARAKGLYRTLACADVAATGLPAGGYGLAIMSLADEHLAELGPVYAEAARLLAPGGTFVLLGYHPFFLMNGMPTHYHRGDGEAVTIESHVHLFSDHFAAAGRAGLTLAEFQECVIDEDWLKTKPKWRQHLGWPISFVLVWRRA
jgi:SAM-dependent methyltransferase